MHPVHFLNTVEDSAGIPSRDLDDMPLAPPC